MIFVQQYGN
jgi:hypothetical protein